MSKLVWRHRETHPPLLSAEMPNSRRLGVWLLVLLLLGLFTDLTLPAGAFAQGSITTSGFDASESSVIASAVARFDRAALDLPSIHIRRAGGDGPCEPHGRTADTWPLIYITICEVTEAVVVHELAHAWTFDHLGPTDQVEWNHRRGVPTWLSRQEPWELRGSEHAADILTWYVYWSDFAVANPRIGGETSPGRYLSDVEWLLTNGDAWDGLRVFGSRSGLITVTYATYS